MKFLFLIFIILTFVNSCGFDCEKYLNKNIRPILIKGIVLEKRKSETGCFGIVIYKNGNKTDTLSDICYCVPGGADLWKYVLAGDSLIKKENSLVVEVIRAGFVKQFDYPCCSQ